MFMGASMFAWGLERIGDWSYFEHVDRITDEETFAVISDATETPRYAEGAGFWVTCGLNELEVLYVLFAEAFLGFEDAYEVTYRVDRHDAVTARWQAIDDESVVISSYDLPRMEADLIAATELLIRVRTRSSDLTYAFPIREFRAAFNRLPCSLFHD